MLAFISAIVGTIFCMSFVSGLLYHFLGVCVVCSSKKSKSKSDISVRSRNYHTTGEITCHMRSHRSHISATWQQWLPAYTPAETGTRFSDPGGMQGWVFQLFGGVTISLGGTMIRRLIWALRAIHCEWKKTNDIFRSLSYFPPHLNYVATLLCEVFKNIHNG